ncbi:cytochrome P450 4V2-like [Uloborus diversus]|uniref:cytochrome P450 4V2-like n=1 Tax=Uloborus diversus TaxID=327109 RepID=UPI0024097E7F|nr:cytochrome P450 4V2-like [Uloborus diversus]
MFYKEGMFAVWLPFRPYVVIHNADWIKMVINHPDALDKAAPYSLMTCLFGDGLLLSNGKKWFHRRKQITPAFHMEILKSYVTIFNEQSESAVSRLKDLIHQPWVNIDKLLSQCSLGILCDSAMGYKLDFRTINKDAENYLHMLHNCAEVVIHRVLRPWTQNDAVFFNCFSAGRRFVKIIHPMKSFTKKVIEDKKTSVMKDKNLSLPTDINDNFKPAKYKKAFLEMMINYHLKDSSFTLDDIQEEVDTFMAAGHDTTALTVRWAIYLLGLHQDVQEKVVLEQKSLFGDDPHRVVTFDDICNMKYTECVIKVIEDKKTSVMKDKNLSLPTDINDNFKPGKYKKAFLEMMINYHLKDSSFTLDDIQEEVDTFMAAGHDTTALTVRWAIYLLGLHQDVQEKVVLEQKSLFGDDPHRVVTFDDICNMKYTECVIKETLRLFPPLPIVAREALKDIQIGPYTIPKSSYIAMNMFMLHRDPKIFPEPEKYKPERFLTENSLDRHPYAFLPFSAGPRNCIGQKFAMMSIKVQLSHLLRNFRITSLDPRDEVNLNWELTLINAKPIRVKFTPR